MSRIRSNELESLRRAVEQYEDIRRIVAQICRENPEGLTPKIRPLFGQRARTVRRLRRAA